MWQGWLHSSGGTVHSGEMHCGRRTDSGEWTGSLFLLVFGSLEVLVSDLNVKDQLR